MDESPWVRILNDEVVLVTYRKFMDSKGFATATMVSNDLAARGYVGFRTNEISRQYIHQVLKRYPEGREMLEKSKAYRLG